MSANCGRWGCRPRSRRSSRWAARVQHVLAERSPGALAYVIGAPAIFRHVADAGQRVVNGTERGQRSRARRRRGVTTTCVSRSCGSATQAVLAGAEMIAAGRDRTFPAEDGPWPGTGAIVAALEYATDAPARSSASPIRRSSTPRSTGSAPGRTLVVGDRLDSDLAGAAAAGLDAAIVLTRRQHSREQAEAATEPAPVAIAEDLSRAGPDAD